MLLPWVLVENPDRLAGWLKAATGTEAAPIDDPWRPTRTPKPVKRPASLPATRRNAKVQLSLRLLGALHGAWTGEDPADYEIVDAPLTAPAYVNRRGSVAKTGHTALATRALTQALAEAGHRVLAFLPGDRHAPFAHARELPGPGGAEEPPVTTSARC